MRKSIITIALLALPLAACAVPADEPTPTVTETVTAAPADPAAGESNATPTDADYLDAIWLDMWATHSAEDQDLMCLAFEWDEAAAIDSFFEGYGAGDGTVTRGQVADLMASVC